MDFDKIFLDKFELKVLKLLNSRSHPTSYHQIHGYFDFPDFEKVLIAVQEMERSGLIVHEIGNEESFLISLDGKKYLLYLKKKSNKLKALGGTVFAILGAIASFFTIIQFLSS